MERSRSLVDQPRLVCLSPRCTSPCHIDVGLGLFDGRQDDRKRITDLDLCTFVVKQPNDLPGIGRGDLDKLGWYYGSSWPWQ